MKILDEALSRVSTSKKWKSCLYIGVKELHGFQPKAGKEMPPHMTDTYSKRNMDSTKAAEKFIDGTEKFSDEVTLKHIFAIRTKDH